MNVAFVGCTLQRKVTNCPDKIEHLYTLLTVCHRKSTPVCGSRMRIRCTCTVQCRIVTRDFAPDVPCNICQVVFYFIDMIDKCSSLANCAHNRSITVDYFDHRNISFVNQNKPQTNLILNSCKILNCYASVKSNISFPNLPLAERKQWENQFPLRWLLV